MIPPILAAHDLSGYGACSLGIVLPVLAACGLNPCALPTAVLSNHTGFAAYTMVEMSEAMQETLRVWKELQIPFRGAYTGFFASAREIRQMTELAKRRSAWIWVVDPVLGDHARLYRTVGSEMVAEMRRLAAHADLLLPNLTEAALLLDRPYPARSGSAARRFIGAGSANRRPEGFGAQRGRESYGRTGADYQCRKGTRSALSRTLSSLY